jgi:hypothetical protein
MSTNDTTPTTREWEATWSKYIAALSRMDAAETRGAWRAARMSAAKVAKVIRLSDPRFGARLDM